MFGNLMGWLISAILLVATGGLIYIGGKTEPRSKSTGMFSVAMKPAKLSIAPDFVPPGTDARDGGQILRELLVRFDDKYLKVDFERFGKAKDKDKLAKAEALKDDCDKLVDAMNCNSFSSLLKSDDLVVYGRKPYMESLELLGKGVRDIGQYYAMKDGPRNQARDEERGRRYIEAVFKLGRVLYEDRQVYKEFRTGCKLLFEAGFGLSTLETDPAKKQRLVDFYNDAKKTLDAQNPVFEKFRMVTADSTPIDGPGDTFEIALKSQEPMWQTEAVLRLGRMKMGYASYADQRAVPEVLDEVSKLPGLKPNVKIAVDRARNITPADFQKLDGY
jgi:hypothetical protein